MGVALAGRRSDELGAADRETEYLLRRTNLSNGIFSQPEAAHQLLENITAVLLRGRKAVIEFEDPTGASTNDYSIAPCRLDLF